MRQSLGILCIVLCCLFFSSCFFIKEEITFKKDGSGHVDMTVDMSQMMQVMGMFLPDSLKQVMSPTNGINTDLPQFESIEGISNARSEDKGNYTYTISYEFSNSAALQKALSVSNQGKDFWGNTESSIVFSKKKLSRSTELPEFQGNNLLESEDENMSRLSNITGLVGSNNDYAALMGEPTYQIVYHLPKKVKKVKNKGHESEIEKDDNAVTFTYKLTDFMQTGGLLMKHDIKY